MSPRPQRLWRFAVEEVRPADRPRRIRGARSIGWRRVRVRAMHEDMA